LAACWIAIGGGDTVAVTPDPLYPVYAFPSDPATWIEPTNNQAPIVSIGMLSGATFEEATGALVAFDGPVQVGTWTLTETVPEPATLSLTFVGLGFAGIVRMIRQRRAA
jgi:hypothetical protein